MPGIDLQGLVDKSASSLVERQGIGALIGGHFGDVVIHLAKTLLNASVAVRELLDESVPLAGQRLGSRAGWIFVGGHQAFELGNRGVPALRGDLLILYRPVFTPLGKLLTLFLGIIRAAKIVAHL